YKIVNTALCEIIASISRGYVPHDMSLLCTGRIDNESAESNIKDCLAMLYKNTEPSSVKRATLYVMGGRRVPVGILNSVVNSLQRMFRDEGVVEVSLLLDNSQHLNTHLLASVEEKTRFDKYDPLGEIIPEQNILDWEEIDSSPDIEIMIPNIE
ncbi:MAG TPA: hypothetical protein VFY68_17360, partial [Nitrososphaeraceae archaeon]|nr:hypothetical protein [Nitrososphaeraceae archaeon]